MNNIELSTSDIIQLIGIVTTSFTSLTAIIISVVSLRQNSKMIEESSRPYISVYIGATQFSQPLLYLIIKNFGESAGTITDFSSDIDLREYTYDSRHIPFGNIIGTTLSPKEEIIFPINVADSDKELNIMNISISYKSILKSYDENIQLNFPAYFDSIHLRVANKDYMQSISYTLQDIAEKML